MDWKLKEYQRSAYKIIEVLDDNDDRIKVFVAKPVDYSEKKRKAQLMAAAPELLEAVEQSYEMIDILAGLSSWDARSEDEINEVMNKNLKAMRKAKGDV